MKLLFYLFPVSLSCHIKFVDHTADRCLAGWVDEITCSSLATEGIDPALIEVLPKIRFANRFLTLID